MLFIYLKSPNNNDEFKFRGLFIRIHAQFEMQRSLEMHWKVIQTQFLFQVLFSLFSCIRIACAAPSFLTSNLKKSFFFLQVLNLVQSYVTLRVPLYVSYVFHSPVGVGGWQHFDLQSELRLTFVYDTAILWKDGIGSPPEAELQGGTPISFYQSHSFTESVICTLLLVASCLVLPSTWNSLLGCLWKILVLFLQGKTSASLCFKYTKLTHWLLLRASTFTMSLYSVTTQYIWILMRKIETFMSYQYFSGPEHTIPEYFDILKTVFMKHWKGREIHNGYKNLSYPLD